MIALLKRHSFLVVGAALSYYSWSAAQPDEQEGAPERQKAPMIKLVEAAAGEQDAPTQALLEDPFRLAAVLKERAARDLAEEAFVEVKEGGPLAEAVGPAASAGTAPAGRAGQPVILRLASTLTAGEEASAIINGERYRVGETLLLAGLEDPVLLEEVVGRAVVLSWQGQQHRLDLVDQRQITLAPGPRSTRSGPVSAGGENSPPPSESRAGSGIPAGEGSGQEPEMAEEEGQVQE